MSWDSKINMAVSVLVALLMVIYVLEETQDVRWLLFKRHLKRKWQELKAELSGDKQRQQEIEQIAYAMGYEPEWIEGLFE